MKDELKTPAQLRIFVRKNSSRKKPKTLRKKVLHPLLITVSVISAVMIVVFNLLFLLILYSGVVNDLKSVSVMLEQVTGTATRTEKDNAEIVRLYKNELERYSISYHTNMIFLDGSDAIVSSAEDFQKNEREVIGRNLSRAIKSGSGAVFCLKTDNDVLVFTPVGIRGMRDNSVFVYASLKSLWPTVKWGNSALLVIIVFAVLAFVVASHIIANNISKPIKRLSEHMETVGDCNFSPVKISESSAEMETLTLSINEMLARLKAYTDAHTRSIQNLSHNLRTPLMSIRGFAEGIKYGVFTDTQEAADVIIKESTRLTEIVEKILMLSDLDTLRQSINMIQLELNSFLDEEAKIIEGYALQSSVKILKFYDSDSITVLADTQLLATIVKNLLSNAIRYARSVVEIRVFEENDAVRLCVADDGDGLSDEDIGHLFVRYYTGKTGHTGLGLSAAKSAAEYMGCRITGENRNSLPKEQACFAEHGAVFTVYFSKDIAAEQKAAQKNDEIRR